MDYFPSFLGGGGREEVEVGVGYAYVFMLEFARIKHQIYGTWKINRSNLRYISFPIYLYMVFFPKKPFHFL